jgi:hypothetical protein
MREFAKGSFVLREAPRPLRLIYAGFLLLIALGLASQLGFQVGRIGVTPSAIARYYRGGESGDVMTFAKTFGQLLEVTHAHAFVMAIVFLILAHLFAATAASPWWKRAAPAMAFAGLLGDLAGPWATRYLASWCSWIVLVAWLAEDGGFAVLVAVSLWECLAPRRPAADPDPRIRGR